MGSRSSAKKVNPFQRHDAEGGTPGLPPPANVVDGSGNPFTEVLVDGAGGVFEVTNVNAINGSKSYRYASHGTSQRARARATGPRRASHQGRIYFKTEVTPAGSTQIARLWDSGSAAILGYFYISTTMKLQIRDRVGSTPPTGGGFAFATTLLANTVYRIEYKVTANGATSTWDAELYVGHSATPAETVTGQVVTSDSTTAWDSIYYGLATTQTNIPSATAHVVIDDLIDFSTARPGPAVIVTPQQPFYADRCIFNIDGDFPGLYPGSGTKPFDTMHMSVIEVQVFSYSVTFNNAKTRLDQLAAGHTGWIYLGNFAEDTGGGVFSLSDSAVTNIISSVTNGIGTHPRNSHLYYIVDEPNMHIGSWTLAQINANRTSLRNRRNLIRSLDPLAIVIGSDFIQNQIDPASTFNVANGFTYGLWGGPEATGAPTFTTRVFDELWCSGYPRPNAVADPAAIPAQAGWCDAAGIDYSIIVSCHNFQNVSPAYPTAAQYAASITQARATNTKRIATYIWSDEWDTLDTSIPDLQLRDNPAGLASQTDVGTQMALVTPP